MKACFLAAAVTLIVHPIAVAQDAKDVVRKAVEAAGGADAIGKHDAVVWNADGEMTLGERRLKLRVNMRFDFPDRYRYDVTLNPDTQAFVVTFCVAGEEGWKRFGEAPPLDLEPHERKRLEIELAVMRASLLAPLLTDDKYQVSVAGDDTVDGRPVTGLNVMRPDGLDVNFYFDEKSADLVKMQYQTVDENGRECAEAVFLSDFKPVQGFSLPTKLTMLRDEKPFWKGEVHSIELKDKLEDALFQRP
ncbi:MAG: outer membrane lipoprotein-sorting protein [Planctomycetes bacterium]|nr:outer membrane lipoprotein-sorting protein [Planctomycetota bacterium]